HEQQQLNSECHSCYNRASNGRSQCQVFAYCAVETGAIQLVEIDAPDEGEREDKGHNGEDFCGGRLVIHDGKEFCTLRIISQWRNRRRTPSFGSSSSTKDQSPRY